MTKNEKLNTIPVLFDIIEQYLVEIKPELRHAMKMLCNKSINSISQLIREIDKYLPEDERDRFGDTSDDLREIIEKFLTGDEN